MRIRQKKGADVAMPMDFFFFTIFFFGFRVYGHLVEIEINFTITRSDPLMPKNIMCHIDVSSMLRQSMGKMTNWVIDTYSHHKFLLVFSSSLPLQYRFSHSIQCAARLKNKSTANYVLLCNNEKITTFDTHNYLLFCILFF